MVKAQDQDNVKINFKDQNKQYVSFSFSTSWIPQPVCGSQPEAHLLLLKM